jgi:hypothetical protein
MQKEILEDLKEGVQSILRVERRFMSQTEEHSSELHEMENRISQGIKEMKEVVRSTKLDDQMDTERSENNITSVKERVESAVKNQETAEFRCTRDGK